MALLPDIDHQVRRTGSILSAEFAARETHAASCDAREIRLWRTKRINSPTTWNKQTADGFWVDHHQTRSFAYGYDGCASKDAKFGVRAMVAEAASKKRPTITFGMRAANEEDPCTWKRFSDSGGGVDVHAGGEEFARFMGQARRVYQ
ncbi:hypothetical protein AB0O64_12695 [Streptomyces sp. NPDC088341]|uniref:hypothetical protein n=1 Tax=Streptomyces sp. NPDC088341 TaxID=3154870 RepID=UPI00341EFB34